MTDVRKILVAVDDSAGSRAALERVLAGHAEDSSEIRLFHVVGPVPPALLEFGGADTPTEEERIEALYAAAESVWFRNEREAARPMLEAARDRLVAGGIAPERVTAHVAEALPEDRLADVIVESARELGCDAIVVGHTSYGWLKEKFHRHVGDALQKRAGDLRVVVVE